MKGTPIFLRSVAIFVLASGLVSPTLTVLAETPSSSMETAVSTKIELEETTTFPSTTASAVSTPSTVEVTETLPSAREQSSVSSASSTTLMDSTSSDLGGVASLPSTRVSSSENFSLSSSAVSTTSSSTVTQPSMTSQASTSSPSQQVVSETKTEIRNETATSTRPILANRVEESSTNLIPIYRLYHPGLGRHLYTTDANEKQVLYTQRGWGYEGIGWYAPRSGQPVYRLYNPGLQNHLYTTDGNEVRVLTAQHGWVSDNGGRPVFYSGGEVTIYRLYNRGLNGRHHWTTDYNEYKVLPGHGWTQEGDKFKALRIGKPIRTQYAKKPSQTPSNDASVVAAYQSLLEEFVSNKIYVSPYEVTDPRFTHTMLRADISELRYAYYDLDNNGVKELLLSRNRGQTDIYTYQNGTVIYLTQGLNHYHGGVQTIYTDGTIVASNWPGVGSPMQYTYYKITGVNKVQVSSDVQGKIALANQVTWRPLYPIYQKVSNREPRLNMEAIKRGDFSSMAGQWKNGYGQVVDFTHNGFTIGGNRYHFVADAYWLSNQQSISAAFAGSSRWQMTSVYISPRTIQLPRMGSHIDSSNIERDRFILGGQGAPSIKDHKAFFYRVQ